MNKCVVKSPLGNIALIELNNVISECYFTQDPITNKVISALLINASKQLREYFEGTRKKFELPIKPNGTIFQKNVWNALRKIPYGITYNYQQIANTIGNPKSARAIGNANGANPICIIIPCHRVIRKSGRIGGYSEGLDKKIFLLELEKSFIHNI